MKDRITLFRTILRVFAVVAGVAWALACGDATTEPPPDPPRSTAVTVTPATAELAALGSTVQLSAEVRDQNGNVMAGATVTWASGAAAVAAVDAAGLVTAHDNGAATVTATAGSASGTAAVTVAQQVSGVAVSPAADTLFVGDTLRLEAAATDANGHPVAEATFAWASGDAGVASVDDSGLVMGVAAGVAEISAISSGVTSTAEIRVANPDVTITVELPYPQHADVNRGISEVIVTCLSGCEGQQVQITDDRGKVTLTGIPPITIRAEKLDHVSIERQVATGSTVAMGHQWPEEVKEAIRQLELTDVVDAGELLLIWADTVYFTGPSHGGNYNCYAPNKAVLVRNWRGRDFMLNTLIHELVHAWQGRNSTKPPCDTNEGWRQSESGKAWIEATEKDLEEVGPIPGFDDNPHNGKTLSEVPQENQATLYADWHMGSRWGRNPGTVTKADFYRMAPHRSQYLESYFGPPR